jgi:4-diphosphocytidyl-2-C-methyl-D-erythritol kinase
MTTPRRASVSALAKINLDLRVLHKKTDGFHELRSIFQTISLADTLEIEFTPSRKTSIAIEGNVDIPDNLVVRAARAAMDAMRAAGQASFRLTKRIPMGAGLGGGSSDAAAVLLALPVLAGKRIPLETLIDLGAQLGSDVPFFLLGGRAVAMGRGTELYPLPERAGGSASPTLLITPQVHVSTADAYRDLRRELTLEVPQNKISSFECSAWRASQGLLAQGENDFESVVFERYPQLGSLKRRLLKMGANPAMMTGSGSALFGVFRSREEAERARPYFREEKVFLVSLVSRSRYQSLWWRRLGAHINKRLWPPQSRYARWTLTG